MIPRTRKERTKIRIGYVSGEFRQQATAILMAGLYERHDRDRFEIIALDSGGNDQSPMRARLEKAFDRWIGITGLSDEQAADVIRDAGIDILVNLNGYFGEARMGVFARRPAPIQVNYLGFPATLGAPYIDYIIADKVVIPHGRAALSMTSRSCTCRAAIRPMTTRAAPSPRRHRAPMPDCRKRALSSAISTPPTS